MDKQTEIRIDELVFKSFEGVISEQECRELEAMIESSSLAREYYCSCIYFNLGMLKVKDVVHQPLQMQMLLEEMAEYEKKAPTIHIEKPIEKSVESWQGMMKVEKPKRTISRLSIYTLMLSAAAMLFLMILVLSSPIRPVVATLTDSINAEWISEDEIPAKWDVLKQGELTLVRGLAEITFDDGAVVVVEAPAVIELESPKAMFVTSGKVSALVSQYATGFTVNTLSGSIIDLGTEFGVSVEDDGSCSLHMFKGMASLIVGKKGNVRTSQIVNANEARSIDEVTGVVKEIKLSEKAFVRHIDSEKGFIWRGEILNLADVVGNGNGFGTGNIGAGIVLSDASLIDKAAHSGVTGKHQYLPVVWSDFIDGVFVPDGAVANVISSQGHKFAEFPRTGNNATLPVMNGILERQRGPEIDLLEVGAKLNSIPYGTQENPAIIMHSNSGITFDLDQIRAKLPGVKITAFRSKCGISETAIEYGTIKKPLADFWVLLDGVRLYGVSGVMPTDGTSDIYIPINENDRFLTLAITDGGDSIESDWCLFADPILELEF